MTRKELFVAFGVTLGAVLGRSDAHAQSGIKAEPAEQKITAIGSAISKHDPEDEGLLAFVTESNDTLVASPTPNPKEENAFVTISRDKNKDVHYEVLMKNGTLYTDGKDMPHGAGTNAFSANLEKMNPKHFVFKPSKAKM